MKIDGITYYNADADPVLCRVADKLERTCPHMKTYYTCQNCPYYGECDKLWNFMSGRSAMCQLNIERMKHYRQLFLQRIGVVI